jgi:hypothetical protein
VAASVAGAAADPVGPLGLVNGGCHLALMGRLGGGSNGGLRCLRRRWHRQDRQRASMPSMEAAVHRRQ